MTMKDIAIIPVLVIVATMSFSVKIIDVYSGLNTLSTQAHAAKPDKDEKADDHAEEKAGKKDKDDHSDDAHKAEKDKHKDTSKKKEEDALTKWRDANDEDFGFNSVKMENLQALEKRRQELEALEKKLKTREALVMASQQEMDRKYKELTEIRTQIETLLDQQSEEERLEMVRLVKIYEGMKAKEAAAIFNTLDLDILVEVFSIMSERKASPILAKMNPERAKTVTIMLAERKTLPALPAPQ